MSTPLDWLLIKSFLLKRGGGGREVFMASRSSSFGLFASSFSIDNEKERRQLSKKRTALWRSYKSLLADFWSR